MDTILNIIAQAAHGAVVGFGMTLALTSGGFDLSVESTMALSSVFLALLMPELGIPLAILVSVLIGSLVGVLNGRGLFVRQASLDVLFATMRTLGLLGVGFLFVRRGLSGALGSAIGFASAAAVIALVASSFATVRATRVEPGGRGTVLGGTQYLLVLLPLAVAQFFTNALMQLDIMLLGRFLSEGAHTIGLAGEAAEKATDEWVAAYRACQLFAFLPYQLLLSLTQVLFPMLARAKVEESKAAVRDYVARGARLGAIAAGMMVAVIAGMPETAIRFAYNTDIAARGAPALRILSLGQGGFAMLGIGCTVLSSLGRERVSAMLTAGATALAVCACAVVVPGHLFGSAQLEATAWCMAAVLAIAVVVCSGLVMRIAGSFVPGLSAVRVAIALAITVMVGSRIPAMPRLLAPVVAVSLACVYGLVLTVSREIKRADLTWALGALRRRRG